MLPNIEHLMYKILTIAQYQLPVVEWRNALQSFPAPCAAKSRLYNPTVMHHILLYYSFRET